MMARAAAPVAVCAVARVGGRSYKPARVAQMDAPAPPADHKVLQVRLKPAEISSRPKTRPIDAQIARAHRRSLPRRPMSLLLGWLERQLTRGIWAAVDRPNPKK